MMKFQTASPTLRRHSHKKQKPKIPSFPRRRESRPFGFSRFR
ncbi:hypothetical protein NEIPOLOT_01124 [Neisseria polysaccharea ATCC 43768]|nr:hypothetical protein NEIPOLOT_01124 [Neisseria polysaccharea ATCC 43768]